jgi:hypothetical protein
LVDPDLDQVLDAAQLQGQRVGHHDVGGRAQLVGGQRLALGGDDLGRLLALGLGWRAIARCMLSGSWMSLSSTAIPTAEPRSPGRSG